jgi:hypothetical protein
VQDARQVPLGLRADVAPPETFSRLYGTDGRVCVCTAVGLSVTNSSRSSISVGGEKRNVM